MDIIIGIILGIGGIIAAFLAGSRRADQKAKAQEAEAYRKTTQELDNAEADVGTEPDAAREWLRKRGQP